MRTLAALCLLLAAAHWPMSAAATQERAQARMLQAIADDFAATARETGLAAMSAAVAAAFRAVPRHAYVEDYSDELAYANRPLPIGHGQTISQPFIVALMTELAALAPGDRVLEIGTGSGYQAAILAALGAEVYTIEIIPELADRAAATLAAQGIDHVQVAIGDGNLGWPEAAPFAAILVTAGGNLPPALIEQLAPGGRLVIPLDTASGDQVLTLIEKDSHGTVTRRKVLPVRFVPLVGGE